MRSLAFLSVLAGLVATPTIAQDFDLVQKVDVEALTPGAAAGPVLGEHRFVSLLFSVRASRGCWRSSCSSFLMAVW